MHQNFFFDPPMARGMTMANSFDNKQKKSKNKIDEKNGTKT